MKFSTNSKPIFNYLLLALCLSSTPTQASAGEGNFGFLYTHDIQPKGQFELDQRIDHMVGQATGSYELTQFHSEIEYGLINNVQIAGYLNSICIHASKTTLMMMCVQMERHALLGLVFHLNTMMAATLLIDGML